MRFWPLYIFPPLTCPVSHLEPVSSFPFSGLVFIAGKFCILTANIREVSSAGVCQTPATRNFQEIRKEKFIFLASMPCIFSALIAKHLYLQFIYMLYFKTGPSLVQRFFIIRFFQAPLEVFTLPLYFLARWPTLYSLIEPHHLPRRPPDLSPCLHSFWTVR